MRRWPARCCSGLFGQVFAFRSIDRSRDTDRLDRPGFPNNALLVAPILSSTLTDALQDRFTRQTRLAVVPENGDLRFEGEITNYTSTPAAVSGEEMAVMNRLTITVRVRFTNAFQPEFNYDKTFSAFSDYSSSRLLQEAEPTLIPEIVDQLVENIFNDAVSNW